MDAIYTQAGLYDAVLPAYTFDGLDDAELAGRELDQLAPTPVRTALELGCGTGRITPHVAAHTEALTCVDANAAMLAEFRTKQPGSGGHQVGRIEPVHADAGGFLTGAPSDSFDLVTAFWSLNYPLLACFETTVDDQIIPRDPDAGHRDAAALLTNLTRVLRPSGRLLIFFFDATSPEQQFVTDMWNRIAPFYGGRDYTLQLLTQHLLTENLRASRGNLTHRHLPGTMNATSLDAAERWFLTGHFKQSPALTGDPHVRDQLHAFLTRYQYRPPSEQAPPANTAIPMGGVEVPTGLHIITYTQPT